MSRPLLGGFCRVNAVGRDGNTPNAHGVSPEAILRGHLMIYTVLYMFCRKRA